MTRIVICDYCGKPAELISGKAIYPHRPTCSLFSFGHANHVLLMSAVTKTAMQSRLEGLRMQNCAQRKTGLMQHSTRYGKARV